MTITRGWLDHAEGSVLVEFGRTRVLCAASVTQGVPRWRKGSGLGWVTAEYAMLPRATNTRSDRESVKGRIGGRTHEISRLIGRSLRAVIDYKALGENTIVIDCDVLQADGGTRTAAITGAYVALADAVGCLRARGALAGRAAARLGRRGVGRDGRRRAALDLRYEEDVRADTDMNVVMTGDGGFVEVQGTAEGAPFDRGAARRAARPGRCRVRRPDRLQQEALASCMSARLVLATRNAHKVAELRQILAVAGLDVERASGFPTTLPEVAETGATFAENALLKAGGGRGDRTAGGRRRLRSVRGRAERHARRAVRAVGGPARRRRGEPASGARPARPTCPTSGAARSSSAPPRSPCRGGRSRWSKACCTGGSTRAARQRRLRLRPDLRSATAERTTAEMTPEEKNAISHRGRAFRALAPAIRELVLTG